MCRRLSTEYRWKDLEEEFFKHKIAFCEIFFGMFKHSYQYYVELIYKFRDEFVQERANIYSRAIEKCGTPLERCVA